MQIRNSHFPPNVVQLPQAKLGWSAPTPVERAFATRTLSCVIPAFNEATNLPRLLTVLAQTMDATGHPWEAIVVDDGSTDDTTNALLPFTQQPQFRLITLSRNFGKEAAITAGLQAARGDAVILLDADLQHSPSLIPQMIAQWQDGADVVYTVRENRREESGLKRWGTGVFYELVNSSNRFSVPKDAGDFRLMDRKVVQALMSLPERTRFMKGLYAWVGFKAVALPYTPLPRASGRTSFNVFSLLHLAIDGLTAFTTWPLRLVSVVGAALALASFVYGGFVSIEYLINGNPVSGWTTIVVCLLFFMGVQMISTGILGEYIGRIFDEVKGRPLFVVKSEQGHGLTSPGE
ncbi:glycosyltransferase family 2 protein [soil metagenome]